MGKDKESEFVKSLSIKDTPYQNTIKIIKKMV